MKKKIWVCSGDHLGIEKCIDCPRIDDCDLSLTEIDETKDPNPLDFIFNGWTWIISQIGLAILFEFEIISVSEYLIAFFLSTFLAGAVSKIISIIEEAYEVNTR